MTATDSPILGAHPVMPAIDTRVGAYYIQGYLAGARRQGIDPGPILDKADIPISADDPEAAIDGEQLQRLLITIRQTLNDHYMGFLRVPGKLAMDAEAGRAGIRGESLGEGLRHLLDFINAVRSDEERECVLGENAGEVSLVYRFSGFVEGVDPHLLYWFRMAWGYRYYCWLVGQRIKLTRVCFSAPRPENGIDYERAFACQVLFSQPADRLCFHKKWLTAPIIRTEMELLSGEFPVSYPNWFTIPGRDQTLSSQVMQILMELSREGMHAPSLRVVARILSMSSRSLSRKLAGENESFQKIKSRLRCNLAINLLLNSDIPVTAVAAKVGFAEPGDFTRAFIGWTGQTPSAYRRQHRTKSQPPPGPTTP